jgi:hypothetical protein
MALNQIPILDLVLSIICLLCATALFGVGFRHLTRIRDYRSLYIWIFLTGGAIVFIAVLAGYGILVVLAGTHRDLSSKVKLILLFLVSMMEITVEVFV